MSSIFNEQKCSLAVGPQLLFLQGMSLRLGGVVLVGRYLILLFSCFITMKGELLGKWRYEQSLSVLKHAKHSKVGMITKSSIMLGLGESDDELKEAMADLRAIDVDILTLGQYLQPTPLHLTVKEYVTPEKFAFWKEYGESIGFRYVASGPLVRSSYRAGELFVKSMVRERASASASASIA
ncbi:Lipoyl synthase, chloroplastic [Vitis vinifera]|uniref:Lipoyl synthase, chloroplastic n=1 Tax=Vitis vinifera TaxID=29760 RepID=A0A438EU83_VITVI|nr:Lipoyl synthase, chloroplastic [Vitis vinifera]